MSLLVERDGSASRTVRRRGDEFHVAPAAPSPLVIALREYLVARGAAILAARQSLRVGELDARALLHIVDYPGTRPGELREFLGITSAGVTTLTDRLVERGVIRRDIDEDDRRVVRLTAVVDTGSEPWSALTRFDDLIASAIGEADADRVESAAGLLTDLTRRAAG